jgi:hypothetical protein
MLQILRSISQDIEAFRENLSEKTKNLPENWEKVIFRSTQIYKLKKLLLMQYF